jgi:serine/threonine-protein kinase
MGEVYRARDTKLNRVVAIKVLPDLFATDPDRLVRFEREAHILASLNHPNIAQIYGVEESSGKRALVMELVVGRTLDEVTPTLAIGDVIAIARQIAEALEAAHEQGIIHRDLKPANVKVRDDGTVKVLDFGLAKAFDPASANGVDAMNSPTLTVHATQMGVVIGTAAYMAPEQARGKAVDKRADIWALGCVLYETLANARAFEGETVSDTIAAVLTKDPDWSKVRPDAPRFLTALAKRCLQKDPRRRFQAIGDVRLTLEEAGAGDLSSVPTVDRRPDWRRWVAAALVLLAGAGVGSFLTRSFAPPAVRTPRTLPMQLAVDVPLALEEAPAFALSRDGTMLAFVGGSGNGRKLYIRRLDDPAATPLEGTDGASSPFFSPDGQWVGFMANESLKKVRIAGGTAPVRLTSATDRGGVWTDDDTIIYAQDRLGPLFRIAAGGGEPAAVTRIAGESVGRSQSPDSHRFPTWIPERATVLFTSRARGADAASIVAVDLRTGKQTSILAGAYHPVYSAPGRLLFMRESALFSVGFDVERLTVTGAERRIVDGVRANVDVRAGQFAASGPILLYQPGTLTTATDRAVMVWRDTKGKERPLMPDPDTYRDPRFSPDGKRLAYAVMPSGVGTDLWVFDRARELKTRLTYEANVAEW